MAEREMATLEGKERQLSEKLKSASSKLRAEQEEVPCNCVYILIAASSPLFGVCLVCVAAFLQCVYYVTSSYPVFGVCMCAVVTQVLLPYVHR